jgi:topoisomerase IA-like protein
VDDKSLPNCLARCFSGSDKSLTVSWIEDLEMVKKKAAAKKAPAKKAPAKKAAAKKAPAKKAAAKKA